jgi:hypothetical protein
MKKNKTISVDLLFLIYYSLVVSVFFILSYVLEFAVNILFLKVIILVNLISLSVVLYMQRSKIGLLHPISLFVGATFLFIYSRVLLDLVGYTDIQTPNMMSDTRINDVVIRKVLIILNVFLSGLSIGIAFAIFVTKKRSAFFNFDISMFVIGRTLFFIGIIPAIYIQVKTFYAVSELGYLAIFRGEIEVEVPLFIRLLAGFFRVGFFLILVSFPTRRVVLKYVLLFSPFIILNLMTGIRGYYLSFSLVLFWYFFHVRKFDSLSFGKVGLGILSIAVMAQLAAMLRDNAFNVASLFLIGQFLYDQSTSILAVVYAVEYENYIGHVGYSNIFDVFSPTRNLLQDRVDFAVNPGAKDIGHSLGGSIVQEHFLLGGVVGLFVFSICWPIFIIVLNNTMIGFRLGIIVLLTSLPNIIFSPRARTLDFISQNIFYLSIIFAIYFMLMILKKYFNPRIAIGS